MFEEAVGLGVGYLVYKGIMSELAKEPVKEGVKVTSEGMLGFKDLTSQELAQAITGTEAGLFPAGGFSPRDPAWVGMFKGDLGPAGPVLGKQEGWTISGSLLPEGFELVGPSTTWLTRPEGLD